MSEKTESVLLAENETPKFLIDLIINQDQATQKWIEFLIAVQAGLIVIFGYLIRPPDVPQPGQPSLPHAALYAIPAFGVLVAIGIARIVARERKWSAWFVNRFNRLPGLNDKVFPKEGNNEFVAQRSGKISGIITVFAALLSLGWIAVMLWIKLSG